MKELPEKHEDAVAGGYIVDPTCEPPPDDGLSMPTGCPTGPLPPGADPATA